MRILVIAALVLSVCPVQAQPRVLPPPEYDRPYDGTLILIRAQSEDEVRRYCPGMTFNLGVALGCTFCRPGECTIIMASDEVIIAAGHDPGVVWRHERAHANGWPAWHPGAR
jgi:hypothetical protein